VVEYYICNLIIPEVTLCYLHNAVFAAVTYDSIKHVKRELGNQFP